MTGMFTPNFVLAQRREKRLRNAVAAILVLFTIALLVSYAVPQGVHDGAGLRGTISPPSWVPKPRTKERDLAKLEVGP